MTKTRIKLIAKDVLFNHLSFLLLHCSDIDICPEACSFSESDKIYYESVFQSYVSSAIKRINI